jgi:hypothetical protein
MAIKVGRWDCKTCGHKGNLGPTRECEKCGAARPGDVKFYLPSDAEIVTDAEEIKEAKSGADWICAFCDSTNATLIEDCENCGASKSDSEKKVKTQRYSLNEVPRSTEDAENLEKKEVEKAPIPPPKVQDVPPEKKPLITKKHIFIALGFVGSMLLIILMGFIFQKDINVEIVEISWKRTLDIEEYMLVEESDWSIPSGGTYISESEEIHHYNQVQVGTETVYEDVEVAVGEESYVCGQEDMGNGYFEDVYCTETIYETQTESHEEPVYEDVPVYDTYYTYSIWRWMFIYSLDELGYDNNAFWPVFVNDDEYIRVGDSIEFYQIIVEDKKNKKHEEELEYKDWKILNKNDEITAKASLIFGFYIGL